MPSAIETPEKAGGERREGSFADRFCTFLVRQGVLTEQKAAEFQESTRGSREPLWKALISAGLGREKDILAATGLLLNVPYVDLDRYTADGKVTRLVPETVARKYRLFPLFKIKNTLTVAMADPTDVVALDDLKVRAGGEVQVVISSENQILQAIDLHYGSDDSVRDILRELTTRRPATATPREEEMEASRLKAETEGAPVIKLVNQVIQQAIRERATDIHIEPQEQATLIRFRIDGVLHNYCTIPRKIFCPLVPRLKIMAGLNITERMRPQDGRFSLEAGGREADFRVATVPVTFGEKITIRILEKGASTRNLKELGMSESDLAGFVRAISEPHGVVIVTGPTGSGKTSTLYAALNHIRSPELNILTVEDPREYLFDGVSQAQVNPIVDFTFAGALRSFLRHDPDIIMVGEIRDSETAAISTQAAITGHLVLTTLHTGSAAGAISRLFNMGVEPYMLSSSLLGVLGQRLIRMICSHCKEPVDERSENVPELGLPPGERVQLQRGRGCVSCRFTGYLGRTGIFEYLPISERIRRHVLRGSPEARIHRAAADQGMTTLRMCGLAKVREGITTMEEVLRVSR